MRRLATQLREHRLVWRDGFLSPRTCATVLDELDYALWRPSTVFTQGLDGVGYIRRSPSRLSETAYQEWFSAQLSRLVERIEDRLARMLGVSKRKFEPWQAIRYGKGGKFDYHYDDGYEDALAADRQTTILIYLSTPQKGGSTRFKWLDVDIKAKAGRLVVWENLLIGGARDLNMLHASTPLRRGNKVALVSWIRQRAYRRLPTNGRTK